MDEKEMLEALEKKFKAVQKDLKDAQEKGASKVELEKCTKAIEKQGTILEDFIAEQKAKIIQGVYKQFEGFLNENKTELETIKKTRSGEITFVPKAVGDISTGNGGDGAEVPPANMNTNLGNFNLRNDNALLNLFSVTSTNSPQHSYTELEPKDGNYAMVAEAGVKPQIDFKWQNRYATPKKAAAHEVLSEEAVTDIPRMMSVAKQLLRKKHDLFKVDRCFFGDGVGENPKGATVYGRTFVAGAMALQLTNPNFMDVVNACITDIYTTHNFVDESSYAANVVLISPIDFFLEFQSAKDGNGLPLYPQASLFNTVTIGGVTIRPWSKVPAGKIMVADAKMYNVSNYIPFSIRVGWINDQFITNQFSMVGESRFFAYVKKFDEQAFIYDDIATIKTAITKV